VTAPEVSGETPEQARLRELDAALDFYLERARASARIGPDGHAFHFLAESAAGYVAARDAYTATVRDETIAAAITALDDGQFYELVRDLNRLTIPQGRVRLGLVLSAARDSAGIGSGERATPEPEDTP
jgi:hypothetical protein